jgi:hypothetical protein
MLVGCDCGPGGKEDCKTGAVNVQSNQHGCGDVVLVSAMLLPQLKLQ